MTSEEEALRRMVVELQILEGTAETLQSRINLVNAALTELSLANTTLDGIDREKEGAKLLVPIGGESYIKAKLENDDEMIVGIGAGVAVEKNLEEAKEIVGKRRVDLEKTRETLQSQLTQVMGRIQEYRSRIQDETRK